MKKMLAFLLAAMFLCFAGAACALEAQEEPTLPVNPYRLEAVALASLELPKSPMLLRGSGLSVALSEPTGDYFEQGLTWIATGAGGDGSYQYLFQLIDPDDRFPNARVHGNQPYSASNTFSYLFVVPGAYSLRCWIRDGAGKIAYNVYDFEIADDGRPTTGQVVQEIVAKCRAEGVTGDFETALWLHDWITSHACYDYSYSYYSADGVLIRGTGVCDSYSKAYQLLLEEAGIWADRVTSTSHAWNIALLDGRYYQIDPTWDDPGSATVPVSGNEDHSYFGLTDAIMTVDHSYTPSQERPCVSYDDNYYIHTGRVDAWIDQPGADLGEDGKLKPSDRSLGEAVAAGLGEYRLRYGFDVPEYYRRENGGYGQGKEQIVYGLSAYAMSLRTWPVDGGTMPLEIGYSAADKRISVSVVLDGTLLSVPGGLASIGEEAFAGDGGFMAAALPEGLESIGARAFADCENLWKVVVPDSVTQIAPDAFEGSPRVNLVCGEGSVAAAYAGEYGVNCVIE